MSEFIKDISSIYWWLSVVVVAIFVRLITDLVRWGLGKTSIGVFKRFKDAYEKNVARNTKEIGNLIEHPEDIGYYIFMLVRDSLIIIFSTFMLYGSIFATASSFALSASKWVPYFGVVIVLVVGVVINVLGIKVIGDIAVVSIAWRVIKKGREAETKETEPVPLETETKN